MKDDYVPPGDAVGIRVAEALRLTRKNSGLTVKAVVEFMNVRGWQMSESSLMRLERYDRRCEVGELVNLAEIYGVPPEYLLAGRVDATVRPGTVAGGVASIQLTAGSSPTPGVHVINNAAHIAAQQAHRRGAGVTIPTPGVGEVAERVDVTGTDSATLSESALVEEIREEAAARVEEAREEMREQLREQKEELRQEIRAQIERLSRALTDSAGTTDSVTATVKHAGEED